jgi:hypothetical protein
MQNSSHLDALLLGLSNERNRLNNATNKSEIELRSVWVKQLEKEVNVEMTFLGIQSMINSPMTDDELLDELLK